MYRIALIIGGALLLAGAALAGTFAGLGSTSTPKLNLAAATTTAATTTTRQDDRGRENEVRGRVNEPGEDISGPCDEAEHANDPRCTGVPAAPRIDDDNVADDRGHDDNRGPDDNSGPGGGGGDDD